MKKTMLVMICLLLLSGCSTSDKPTEGLNFKAENGYYVVNSYSGTEINVIIPDTYNEMPVKAIGEDCFANSDIQSIKIGKNIEEIRPGAFYNATMLKEVKIPSSVKTIGIEDVDAELRNTNKYGAFQNCINLKKVVFESGSQLERIGFASFGACSKLEEIALPETTAYIATYAFNDCVSLKCIDIPERVTYMGMTVFGGFTADQMINVLGSIDEWPYTSATEYNGVTIDRTWKNNCGARINYYVVNNNADNIEDKRTNQPPDVNQIQSQIERILNSSNAFCYGIIDDSGIGYGAYFYYLRSSNNDFHVLDISVNEDGKSARVNCCYESDGVKYYGYYDIYYDASGWYFAEEDLTQFYMRLTENDFDYATGAIGDFFSKYRDEFTRLTVHKIEHGIITYSLESNNSIINKNFEQGKYITANFNSKTGEFLRFHYDIERDIWGFGAVEVGRVS